MRSFAAARAMAAIMVALGLLVRCHSIAAASSAPPPSSTRSVVAEAANPLLNPPVSDGYRLPVAIAMRVINISDIDEVTQRFKMVGYLIAHWKDPRLAFTPQASWEKFRTYSPNQIWYPRFDFVNGVVPHSAFDVTIRVFPDGTVRYSERSSAELSNTFRLRTFPFDRQTLEILIHPTVAEDALVELTPEHGAAAMSAEPRVYESLAQWAITGTSAAVEQVPGLSGESISEIRFTIKIARHFNFYIWKVFLPLLLMVVLSWTVFWIDPRELSSQVQISVTTILTVIAFAFAIQANLPKVPYLTFIDVFFLVCYLFVFATAIELTAVHLAGRSGHAEHVRRLSNAFRIVLPAAFVIVNLIMVLIYFG
jgi:hypothetical protein